MKWEWNSESVKMLYKYYEICIIVCKYRLKLASISYSGRRESLTSYKYLRMLFPFMCVFITNVIEISWKKGKLMSINSIHCHSLHGVQQKIIKIFKCQTLVLKLLVVYI